MKLRLPGLDGCLLVPCAAWVLSKSVACAAALSLSLSLGDPLTWARFDSFHYMSNAAHGYHLQYMPRFLNGHATLWAGNTINWPLYAWLSRYLGALPVSLPYRALLLSTGFHLTALVLLWTFWLRRQPRAQGLLLMALAAVFPGMIYYQAISPVSLFISLTMAFLYLLSRERWLPSALVGFLAGMAHTSALFLPAAVGIWALWRRPVSARRLLGAGAAAISVLVGFGLVLVVMRIETGVWDAAPKTWEYYRYVGGWSFLRVCQMVYMPPLSNPTGVAKAAVMAQGAMAALFCVLAAIGCRKWRKAHDASDAAASLLLVFAWVFWIMPHLSPLRQSFYRNEASVLPVIPLLAFLPRWVLVLLFAASAGIAFAMSRQFFLSILI